MNRSIVDVIARDVEVMFRDAEGSHDWWHVFRVWQLAKEIGEKEGADVFVCEIGALVHDVGDWKTFGGDEEAGYEAVREFLRKYGLEQRVFDEVMSIVERVSYRGGVKRPPMKTLAGKCVQDADRLDALGAIGIARTFAYGGHKGHLMNHPEMEPRDYDSKEAYFNTKSTSVNHFYEKLFKLKGLMNTETGKGMAEKRHGFMEDFLDQFYKEWPV